MPDITLPARYSLADLPKTSLPAGFFDAITASDKPALSAVRSASPPASVDDFVRDVSPVAQRVADRLQVPVEAVIGQWGLETGWGKSVVPGTHNLGNIKDFSGRGVAAVDNQTGTRDRYRQYSNVDEFADDFTNLVGGGRYRAVPGSKDAQGYFSALKNAGYAESDNYVDKGVAASRMAADALSRRPPAEAKPEPPAPLPDLSQIPKWPEIAKGKKYQSLPLAEKQKLKASYFDDVLAPHVAAYGNDVKTERERFLTFTDDERTGLLDKAAQLGLGVLSVVQPEKSVMQDAQGLKADSFDQKPGGGSLPVRPEVVQQVRAQWDAASPEQRKQMAARQDVVGLIAV